MKPSLSKTIAALGASLIGGLSLAASAGDVAIVHAGQLLADPSGTVLTATPWLFVMAKSRRSFRAMLKMLAQTLPQKTL